MRFETGKTQDGQPGPEGPHSEADILPDGAVPSGRGPGRHQGLTSGMGRGVQQLCRRPTAHAPWLKTEGG
jgi:hypothetical protein